MDNRTSIHHIDRDFDVEEIDSPEWGRAGEVWVGRYWSGEPAPEGRHFAARLLWSDTALYVRFLARQTEESVVSDSPDLSVKTIGLWDRDVCEIFIAPDAGNDGKYFEFEIAPTGEWLDLAIRQGPEGRETDWNYRSGLRSFARTGDGKVEMALKIEWAALGGRPAKGDVRKGNLFRCAGSGESRGYLAWQPTLTPQPNFHVPARFGEFNFV